MKPFEVEFAGNLITIQPLENGKFEIYDNFKFLGIIEPLFKGDLSTDWITAGQIDKDFAAKIGTLISERKMQ